MTTKFNNLELSWKFGVKEDLSDAYQIYRDVFLQEQQVPEKDVFDGTDAESILLVVYHQNKPIGTGRIRITHDAFVLGRIAVRQAYRGDGIGKMIVQNLVDSSFNMGSETQVLNAQVTSQAFYEKLGFTAKGDIYQKAGIDHIWMEHHGGMSCDGCMAQNKDATKECK